jgi:acylphosphatase
MTQRTDLADHPRAAARVAEDGTLTNGTVPGGTGARLAARVEGMVQGVGFRAAVWRQATRLGLSGWAANLPDGSVEVVAEGPRARCGELLAWLSGSRTPGQVKRVTHQWEAASGGFPGFSVR